jgi:hypothetical protein
MFRSEYLPWVALFLAATVLAFISYPAHPQKITVIPVKPITGQTTPPAPVRPTAKFILPPVEYDKHYDGDLTIKIVPDIISLKAACVSGDNPLPAGMMLACAWHNAKSCVIYMVEDRVMREHNWNTGLLLRHEIAHCNGWPADHPGERAVRWPTTHFIAESERIKR